MAARFGAGSAQLSVIVAQLNRMDERRVNSIIRGELSRAITPLLPAVRASIMNTPAHGPKHTGLRGRISNCVESWAKIEGPIVTAGVEVNSSRMPDGEKSLPLMLEGDKVWRHPIFGDRAHWVGQASHPYFWQAVSFYGPASRRAVDAALDDIKAQISG